MRIIWGLIGISIGTFFLWKTFWLVGIFGTVPWAEEHLRAGMAGTYFLYKLIGLATIALSAMYMFRIWIFA